MRNRNDVLKATHSGEPILHLNSCDRRQEKNSHHLAEVDSAKIQSDIV